MEKSKIKKLLKQIIIKNEDKMIEFRRDLHKYPELPWEEVKTTNKIADALEKHNIPYRRTVPTGLIGEIKGEKPGKTVLLRADIDALPIQELNDNIYLSAGIPGYFALLGSGNIEKKTDCSHHNGYFNIDEDVLKIGATLYAYYAFEYLYND